MTVHISVTIQGDTIEEVQETAAKLAHLGGSVEVAQPAKAPAADKKDSKTSKADKKPDKKKEDDKAAKKEDDKAAKKEDDKAAKKEDDKAAKKKAAKKKKDEESNVVPIKGKDEAPEEEAAPDPELDVDLDIKPFKEITRLKGIVREFQSQGVEDVEDMIPLLVKMKPALPYLKRLNDDAVPKRMRTAFQMVEKEDAKEAAASES